MYFESSCSVWMARTHRRAEVGEEASSSARLWSELSCGSSDILRCVSEANSRGKPTALYTGGVADMPGLYSFAMRCLLFLRSRQNIQVTAAMIISRGIDMPKPMPTAVPEETPVESQESPSVLAPDRAAESAPGLASEVAAQLPVMVAAVTSTVLVESAFMSTALDSCALRIIWASPMMNMSLSVPQSLGRHAHSCSSFLSVSLSQRCTPE